MKPCKYGGKNWVIVTFVQLSKVTIECGNTIIYADRMKCLLLACCSSFRMIFYWDHCAVMKFILCIEPDAEQYCSRHCAFKLSGFMEHNIVDVNKKV